jgi:malate synthase
MNEIITVDQLPIIRQSLADISADIKRQTAEALSMVCTEDTVKFVKAYRAELNGQKKELEDKRIAVKKEIMKPYDEFEKIFKELISTPFSDADSQLKAKIDDVENEIKRRKEEELRAYHAELLADISSIDFLPFERLRLNITKTESTASLKKQIQEFVYRVADDVEMISEQPDSAEIMVEYIQTLNASQAIMTISARKKAVEAQKRAMEIASTPVINPIDDFDVPDPFDDFTPPLVNAAPTGRAKIRFEVSDSVEKIDELFDFLRGGRYDYREI